MASASGGGSGGGGGVAEYGFGAQEQRWKGTHPRRRKVLVLVGVLHVTQLY